MSVELDLGNAANWEQIHYSSRQVSFINNYLFNPLSEIDVTGGVLLDTSLIATFADSSSARPTWKTAGWLHQKIRIGIVIGGGLDAEAQNSSRVMLGRTKVHFFKKNVRNYGLSFVAPKWMQQLSLTVWKYTGAYANPELEAIDLARIDILRTEAKVDALFREMGER